MTTVEDVWPDISCHKRRAAYYQAGHAVMALRESLNVICVSIDDDASWIEVQYPDLSQSQPNGSTKARSNVKKVIRALLAGPAAQSRYSFGTYPADGPKPPFNLADRFVIDDEAVWRAIALAGVISKDSPSLIHSLWQEVIDLVDAEDVWTAMEAVANSLLINGELAGCEVQEIAQYAISNSN